MDAFIWAIAAHSFFGLAKKNTIRYKLFFINSKISEASHCQKYMHMYLCIHCYVCICNCEYKVRIFYRFPNCMGCRLNPWIFLSLSFLSICPYFLHAYLLYELDLIIFIIIIVIFTSSRFPKSSISTLYPPSKK